MMPKVDVCVLGAGPAGFAAAMRAHDLGKTVVIIERERLGGAGVFRGALSSKTMWHLSQDYARVLLHDRGYLASQVDCSFDRVMDEVRAATRERETQFSRQLAALSEPDARGAFVRLIRGRGKLVSPHLIEIRHEDGSVTAVEAENVVIATGSTPRVPAGITIDEHFIMTSDHVEGLPDFPKTIVIVGAGVVGCEHATIFSNFGKTQSFIIDQKPRILPFEDEDVAEVVAANFEASRVMIHRESKLESMSVKDGIVEYVVTDASGVPTTFRVERALVSVGRVPNLEGIGLEAVGVRIEHGGIVADGTRTTVPNIYAAGDVTMDIALVNIAELEGRHAAEKMFGLDPPPIRYESLSTIMFLSPEVASVGLNELQAKAKKIPYRVASLDSRLVARNIAMRNTNGFLKLLVDKTKEGNILGLRVVGPQASSTIAGIAFLIDKGGTLRDIEHCVHPHPAVTEGVQECARLLLGTSLWKPGVFDKDHLLRVGEG